MSSHALPNTSRLRAAWVKLSNPRGLLLIYAEIGALLVLALAALPGGFDYLHFFHKVAQGCVNCAYNPYFLEWFLKPLGWLPWRASYLLLAVIGIAAIWWIARQLGGSPFVVLASPTFLWILWLGQVDILPALGLGIAWWSTQKHRPVMAGLGLLLLATKPQLGAFALLLLLLWNGWRALLIPLIAAAASFLIYGLDWPLRWLGYTPQTVFGGDAWFYIAPTWLLVSLMGVFFIRGRREQLHYAVAVTLAGAPFLGAYSFFVLLLLPMRWWEIAVAYVPFALMGITGRQWWLGLLLLQPLLVMARLLWQHHHVPAFLGRYSTLLKIRPGSQPPD